ncbi:hypothetical protein [Lacinutrix venerupis]|uniref:Lipoprotein n=1 Tax=Lacinutrix venerupis TaxID=1486034 RepID=A0AAC9PWJ3_9FLAO|nr:hypothetical protein [Lacinutrix venerupis]APX99528.1 hypothetical protein BWR22_04095 [Lacinutrix venerupis]
MKKTIFALLTILIVMTSCNKEVDLFLISKNNIGLLTDSTQVKDLKTVFVNDSIVRKIAGDEFLGNVNEIKIFEKGGKPLLELLPKEALDSTTTIGTVKIIDPRFKTKTGISTLSTFSDIKQNHKISSIENTMRNVIIFVDENNTFFTISKEELPEELRYDEAKKIDEINIPDNAKIKYFMVRW